MLSRVADTIYWLARYMERTQSMLQVIRVTYIASQDEQHFWGWKPMLYTYGDLTRAEISELKFDTAKALDHLIFDKHNAVSVTNNIVLARENARAVQDNITKEVWQGLNDYYHAIRQPELAQQVKHEDPISGIDFLLKQGLLFAGTVQHTMPRDEGYVFLTLGKFLERAIQTTDIVRITQPSFMAPTGPHGMSAPELRYLLYALYGYELYTKTNRGNINPASVLQLIVYNEDFPHSLTYCLGQLLRYCERLRHRSLSASFEQVHYLIGKTKNNVAYSSLRADSPDELTKFLAQTRSELLDIAAALNTYYFGNS
jgi:uncharacterized alpha-E superfamily protein